MGVSRIFVKRLVDLIQEVVTRAPMSCRAGYVQICPDTYAYLIYLSENRDILSGTWMSMTATSRRRVKAAGNDTRDIFGCRLQISSVANLLHPTGRAMS